MSADLELCREKAFGQAQPQAPAQTQRGLRLASLSFNQPPPPPHSPTRESIFQTQIDLDLKSKVVGHNG